MVLHGIVWNMGKNVNEHQPAEKPISLKPLEFEEALESLLKVKPKPPESREDD